MTGPDGGQREQGPFMVEHPASASPGDPEAAVMMRNGITRTTIHHYHVEGYRYTSLADAMAEVRRSVGRHRQHPEPA